MNTDCCTLWSSTRRSKLIGSTRLARLLDTWMKCQNKVGQVSYIDCQHHDFHAAILFCHCFRDAANVSMPAQVTFDSGVGDEERFIYDNQTQDLR